jgi:hypothetical protein
MTDGGQSLMPEVVVQEYSVSDVHVHWGGGLKEEGRREK